MGEISPGKVQNLSPRAAWLYPMRLDEVWALLFPASSPPAHWPHCQFVYLRSKVCSPLLSASPRGYALRFATVTIIGSGWLLSSNKILPMLGTLGQTIGFCRLPCHGQKPKKMTVLHRSCSRRSRAVRQRRRRLSFGLQVDRFTFDFDFGV